MPSSLILALAILLPGIACASPGDSILYKQKIGRWGMGVGDAVKMKSSVGFVYLTTDSLKFRATKNSDYDFSVSYRDIITVFPTSPPYLYGRKIVNIETSHELYKIGGSSGGNKLISLIRERVKNAGVPASEKRMPKNTDH